jgi:hypothetical protein
MVSSIDTLICFTAQVAMKMRDDYNVSVDVVPQHWFAARIHRYCDAGDDVATATFKIVNENAVR